MGVPLRIHSACLRSRRLSVQRERRNHPSNWHWEQLRIPGLHGEMQSDRWSDESDPLTIEMRGTSVECPTSPVLMPTHTAAMTSLSSISHDRCALSFRILLFAAIGTPCWHSGFSEIAVVAVRSFASPFYRFKPAPATGDCTAVGAHFGEDNFGYRL